MLDIEPSPTPLERKIYNAHYDNLLATGQFNPDLLPFLDAYQMASVSDLRRAIQRYKRRTQEFIPEDKYKK